ncbi:SUR7/PalI family-domain-containing protein [Naematelia encephala]|uniref:SUR7/PalI family-domain-containing protein n=1 Tax=Naematelia encephala TaxID=71784 RepID=A0A1Y2BL10_9TREE|nr:SUR7/PalI family-domain-containing protein [Naematelia encephala]
MAIRYRSATPGVLLLMVTTALLAVVSFNTPLLKSLYFLQATYSSGDYDGTLKLGTLGFCLESGGSTNCTGPTVGYEFNPNTLLGVTSFDIPEAITKYLTYTLVIHIVALACAAASVVFGLLSFIPGLALLCFPTCTASMASGFSLLALVFDLVIFYIAKTRIDKVDGASASIGACVWLTLAAWLCAGLGGCAYGIGNCCFGSRRRSRSVDDDGTDGGPDPMRLHAIRAEQVRQQQKEQGLPSFESLERTPLNSGVGDDAEDKYLYEDQPRVTPVPGAYSNVGSNAGLRRDGSVLQGVGLGYGRRTPRNQAGYNELAPVPSIGRRPSAATHAGAAGVGAGGGGIEQPDYGYYDQQNGYDQGYNDPYAPHPQQQGGYDYSYPPAPHTTTVTPFPPPPLPAGALQMPNPNPNPNPANTYNYASGGPSSSDSHYADPGPRVTHADPQDPYGGYSYADDGLGAIGRMAQSPDLSGGQTHQAPDFNDQTYRGGVYNDVGPSGGGAGGGGGGYGNIHVPTPQHLIGTTHADLLRGGPMSPSSEGGHQQLQQTTTRNTAGGGGGGGLFEGFGIQEEDEQDQDQDGTRQRPPSYGSVAAPVYDRTPPEKGTYR